MPKRGDVREIDGFIFWGLERKWYNKDEFREKWLSPDAFARKKISAVKSSMKSTKLRKAADPEYARLKREDSADRMRKAWGIRPKEMMVVRKRAFCKKYDIAFDLTCEDFEIPEFCPLLGVKLSRGVGIAHEYSPELDRIIPSKGYVKGNVWVISRKANMIKTNATIEEIRLVASNWPW